MYNPDAMPEWYGLKKPGHVFASGNKTAYAYGILLKMPIFIGFLSKMKDADNVSISASFCG